MDCSDGRPDRDCLSGRLGATQAAQTCNGIAVHCSDGFYACGKCGFGGFAMCTCRQDFTCNPHAP